MQELILTLMFFGFLCDTIRRYWIQATLVIGAVTAITVISGGSWLCAASLTAAIGLMVASARSVAMIKHIQNS